jgi:hypothetical protein
MFCHNGVHLGIKFPLKLQFDFYVLLKSSYTRFLHIASFYFIFDFYFWKKSEFGD